MVDANAPAVTTGTVLVEGSDYGSDVLGAGHAAIGGIAVATNITGSPSTQNAWLVEMSKAISGSTGHNGLVVCGAVPGEATGSQNFTVTQLYPGPAGNTTITEAVTHANYTVTSFTGGLNGGVASLESIRGFSAVAHTSNCTLEIFACSA